MDGISFITATLTDNRESCPNMINHLLIIKRNNTFSNNNYKNQMRKNIKMTNNMNKNNLLMNIVNILKTMRIS